MRIPSIRRGGAALASAFFTALLGVACSSAGDCERICEASASCETNVDVPKCAEECLDTLQAAEELGFGDLAADKVSDCASCMGGASCEEINDGGCESACSS